MRRAGASGLQRRPAPGIRGWSSPFHLAWRGLRSERSRSVTASLNYIHRKTAMVTNISVPICKTHLSGAHNRNCLQARYGSPKETVACLCEGVNAEFQKAIGREWILQLGLTKKRARYRQEELIWEDIRPGGTLPDARTSELLRTPDIYGFWSLNWEVNDRWSHDLSGTITGPMRIPHVIDPQTEQTVIKDSPAFVVVNWKSSYRMQIDKRWSLTAALGIKNLLNAYQTDFDRGAEKDAGYIYGPLLPRTFTFSLLIDRN